MNDSVHLECTVVQGLSRDKAIFTMIGEERGPRAKDNEFEGLLVIGFGSMLPKAIAVTGQRP